VRAIIEIHHEHKKLSDQVAEFVLELNSLKDEYNTLCCGLCSKVSNLAKTVEKDGA
jgi:hypothetical protein